MGVNISVPLIGVEARFETGSLEAVVSALLAPQVSASELQHVVDILHARDAKEKDGDALE